MFMFLFIYIYPIRFHIFVYFNITAEFDFSGTGPEVYGNFNQKKDFVPKVIEKADATVKHITERLMQAFMFQALDEKEFKIVVDAIEEVAGKGGEAIITEGE